MKPIDMKRARLNRQLRSMSFVAMVAGCVALLGVFVMVAALTYRQYLEYTAVMPARDDRRPCPIVPKKAHYHDKKGKRVEIAMPPGC